MEWRQARGGPKSILNLLTEADIMKALGFLAALALTVAPAISYSQSSSSASDGTVAATPEPGGVSQAGALTVFGLSGIPAGAVVVGGVVILAGVVVGVVAASDDDSAVATNTN